MQQQTLELPMSRPGPREFETAPRRSTAALLLGVVTALVLIIGGLLAGVEVDAIVHGTSARNTAIANATAPYVVVAGLLAMLRRTPWRAALDSGLFFVAFVLGYYVAYAKHAGVGALNRHYAGMWLLIALVICPVLAAATCWARQRRGVLRAVVFAIPAAGALAEALTGRTWGMANVLADSVTACDLAVAVAYILVIPRGVLTRAAAAVWATPCTIAIVVLLHRLSQTNAYDHWMYGQ